MRCKNCESELKSEDKYCFNCGALVVNERLTMKYFLSNLLAALGWDNRFFQTFRDLLLRPQLVIEKYLNGTRKRYSSPSAFFAIVLTFTVLVAGFNHKQMVKLTTNTGLDEKLAVTELNADNPTNIANPEAGQTDAMKLSGQFGVKYADFIVKYLYYMSFLFLPFYTLISLWVFGKQNNYAEHLVINAYIQGQVGVFSLLLLFVAIAAHSSGVYFYGQLLLTFFYYLYAYGAYRQYSVKQHIGKIFRFLWIILLVMLAITIISAVAIAPFVMKAQ